MLLSIAIVAGLAYWDAQREETAALEDFADEQAMLASGLSRALAERLGVVERDALDAARELGGPGERDAADDVHVRVRRPGEPPRAAVGPSIFRFDLEGRDDAPGEAEVPMARLLSSIRSLERPGSLRILVRAPGQTMWTAASDGSEILPAPIADAARRGASSVRLSRTEAADLGLPARLAMAGIARVETGALGVWDVAVVATAQAERDRELRAKWRLMLGVFVAGLLVLAFGGLAARKQREEIELRHALALEAVRNQRDGRLGAADKLATMSALATGVAHEVSTPLGVIVARAEQIVDRSDVDERTSKAARVIVGQVERIHEVVRGFLSLARGHMPRLDDHDPAALAREALDLVEHRFAKAGVTLTSTIEPRVPLVACDARMIEQVIVNLLLNACDACERGGTVELAVRTDGEHVAFVVTDDGTGISEEAAARAKEPFFTTKPEGSGLGLAIANEIVNHHCGSLVLRPRATGRGTQAVVELPVSGANHGR